MRNNGKELWYPQRFWLELATFQSVFKNICPTCGVPVNRWNLRRWGHFLWTFFSPRSKSWSKHSAQSTDTPLFEEGSTSSHFGGLPRVNHVKREKIFRRFFFCHFVHLSKHFKYVTQKQFNPARSRASPLKTRWTYVCLHFFRFQK